MEKWWDNAKDWVKVLICIVVSWAYQEFFDF